MKYKVGDKVKIKTWDKMEKEYGISTNRTDIDIIPYSFIPAMENKLNNIFPQRNLTIRMVVRQQFYLMKEINYYWTNEMIECLVSEKIYEPIHSRFEILDIRDD